MSSLYGKPISLALAGEVGGVIIASRDDKKCREYAAELQKNNLYAEEDDIKGSEVFLASETSTYKPPC
jgi:hypothetical protein